jgi:hypothetical protein
MEQNDEMLWAYRQKKSRFRKQLISYVLVNCFYVGYGLCRETSLTSHAFPLSMAGLGHVLVGHRAGIQFCLRYLV